MCGVIRGFRTKVAHRREALGHSQSRIKVPPGDQLLESGFVGEHISISYAPELAREGDEQEQPQCDLMSPREGVTGAINLFSSKNAPD
jgi:hypothetical protein